MPVPPQLLIGAIGSVAGGLTSLFGGRKRREEEATAKRNFESSRRALDSFQFQNNQAGLENVFEDQTINQTATNFQAQQADQSLASTLDALLQSGGGGGSAQAIANAALQSKQGISADIARQEERNNQSRLAEQSRLNDAQAAGADRLQDQQFAQLSDRYDREGARFQQAQAARQEATSQLIGGITGAATLAGGAGLFGDKIQGFLGGGASSSGGGGGSFSNPGGNAGQNFLNRTQGLFDSLQVPTLTRN